MTLNVTIHDKNITNRVFFSSLGMALSVDPNSIPAKPPSLLPKTHVPLQTFDETRTHRNNNIKLLLSRQVFNECMPWDEVDADFVYFGCGLHFLQLIPERQLKSIHLDRYR